MQVTINDISFPASENETVLDVAKRNGIYIPTLCFHEKTGQSAKCRACIVEVEGMRGFQTSCNLKIRDGMKVQTETKEIVDTQRQIAQFLLYFSEMVHCLLIGQESS